MGITDSTTTLDTAWSEQSFVEIPAGTLSTEADLVSAVEVKLQRGTLSGTTSPSDASVKQWLIRAKEELASIKGFTFTRRFVQATLAAGDFRIGLPEDYNGGSVRVRDVTNQFSFFYWPNHIFDAKFPDLSSEASNNQFVFTIKNLELWIAPPARGTPTIEIEYNRSGDDQTANDYAWLPEIERWRCIDYALSEAFESLENFQNAQYYRQKWQQGIGSSTKANARRMWKELGYRGISILEKEHARQFRTRNVR